MKKSSLLFSLIIIFLIFSQFNCSSPTAPKNEISFSAVDVVCTEVWLKLGFTNSSNGGEYEITRNGNVVLAGTLSQTDTVLVDTTVQPSKSYNYIAYQITNGNNKKQSLPIQVTTLDSTSSSYSWQLYKFGDFNATGMPSELYDVSVINDTDIWAVGEIYSNDSAGQLDPQPYNLAIWNGKDWKLQKVPYYYQGQDLYLPIHSVLSFNANDIWFEAGTHWDGHQYNTIPLDINFSSNVNKMYGGPNHDIYIVGNNGLIAHRGSNGLWQMITSGTSMGFFDIYSNNGNNIYICGGSYQNYDGILLEGNENGFHSIAEGKSLGSSSQLFKPYFDGIARTVWVSNTGTVFFAGNWLYRDIGGQISFVKSLPGNHWGGNTSGQYSGFLSQIRGLAENQMILVGERNTIRYFNGVRWKQLGMPYDPNSNYTWLSTAITNDLIVVVGYTTNPTNGIIMMLKRK